MSEKGKKLIYWLSVVGPIASALKTCVEVIIEVLRGRK